MPSPWPPEVIRPFQKIPANPKSTDFHGAYTNLLLTHFRPAEKTGANLTVVPIVVQVHDGEGDSSYRKTMPFMEVQDVDDNWNTVFILQLKGSAELEDETLRAQADEEIRRRMAELIGSFSVQGARANSSNNFNFCSVDRCPLPILHAVSAMGTKFRFYRASRDTGSSSDPLGAPKSSITSGPDIPSVDCWDCDILEEEGARRFRAVVDYILEQVGHASEVSVCILAN